MAEKKVHQPVDQLFGAAVEDPSNPLKAKSCKINQPISIVFGEGSSNGCHDNRSTDVILDSDGKPKGIRINQHHGYTEATNLNVVKQPINTRFGDPLKKETIPLPPLPQRKEVGFPTHARAPVATKKRDNRPFLEF